MSQPILYVIGMPLDERAPLAPAAVEALNSAQLVIGESASTTRRRMGLYAKDSQSPVFLLDHGKEMPTDLFQELGSIAKRRGSAALFSDCGMPILYDPGSEVVLACRSLGFAIRTVAGPTSWGLACCLSAYPPPFLVVGFLPKRQEERIAILRGFSPLKHNTVLMEAPYRFESLIQDCATVLGEKQNAYLAWDIALPGEWHAEGSLRDLRLAWTKKGSPKGEFVLILKAQTRPAAGKR